MFCRGAPQLVSDERLFDAVDVILTMQNSNGGFASYELVRGPTAFMEMINPAEVFGMFLSWYESSVQGSRELTIQ